MEPTSSENVAVQNTGKFQISNLPLIPVVIGVVVLLLLILGVIFLFKPNASNNKALIDKAETQMSNADYDGAATTYKAVLNNDKNNMPALNGIITANSSEGNQSGSEDQELKNSMPYIEQALKLYPNDPLTLQSVGYAYETAGDYKKALDYYEKATKIDPNSSNAWFRKGHALQFLNRNEEAQSAYNKANELDPNNPWVLMAQGNQLMSKGDAQGSYEAFLKASKAPDIDSGTKAEALVGAASARATQNNFQYISEVLKLSKEAVDTNPNFSPALATYGYTLYLTTPLDGDKSEAIDYLKKAIEANPNISKNYLTLSVFYRVQKKYDAAISNNKQAIALADNDNTLLSSQARKLNKGDYTYELAKTYYLANQRDLVIPTLKDAIELSPFVRETVKNDFTNNGQFTDLAANTEFISLISK